MKKYIKVILVPLIAVFILPLILSIINLFNIEINSIFYLICTLIITITTGILLGLITEKKAYLKGLALGGAMSLIMFLTSLILKCTFNFYSIIYYLIIIVATTMGSIIGISKKR